LQYFIVNFSVPSTINLLLLYFVEVEVVQVQEGEVHHIPIMRQVAQEVQVVQCHTRLSEENQVHTYMHARIKFHAYSDIKVNTETVSRMKRKIIRDLRIILETKAPDITGNRLGVAYA
jgi:hypothetical protein